MSWTVELRYTPLGSWVDITTLVLTESIRRTWVKHKELAPVVNTLEFDMHRNATVINALMTADQPEIRVQKDSAWYFTGDIRNNFKIKSAQKLKATQIECVDYGERLKKKKMDWTAALSNYKVCDTTTPAASIVHYLLTQEGSGITLNVSTINKTIPLYVNVGGRDDTTYWEALEDLLFQFGYVFDFDPQGRFTLFDMFPTSTSTIDAFDPTNTRKELEIEKRLEDYDGVEVTWWSQKTETGAIVFQDRTGGNTTNEMNVTVNPGGFYPGDGTRKFYAKFDYGGAEILSVANASLSYLPTSGLTLNTFTNFFTQAEVELENTGGIPRTITRFRITGDVTYRDETNIIRSENWSTSLRRLKLEAKHLADGDDAKKLCTGVRRYYDYGKYRYRLRSLEAFVPGSIIDVEDDNLGIDHRCIIVEQRIVSERGATMYEYLLDAIEAYSAETPEEEAIYNPPLPLPEVIDTLPSTTTVQDMIDDGYTNTGGAAATPGTTTPTIPTVVAKGTTRAVILEWDRQSNLTNFARYEVQVSDDDDAWYDLDFDGDGLGSTLNGDTDWYATVLVHAPLPLDGDADDPAPSTWYYRVRRVTKAAVASDWSTSVSAAATAVTSGMLAADSVWANNIRAASIEADKMAADNFLFTKAVGSINKASPTAGDVRSYLGKDPAGAQAASDPVEIAIEEYNGTNWERRLKGGMRIGGGVADLFVSGFFEAGESVLSSPGLMWVSRSNPFGADWVYSVAASDDVVIAVGRGGKIARSTDHGASWGSLITNPFGSSAILNIGYGNEVWVAVADGGKIARSTDGGVSWGSLITNPFGTSGVTGVAYGATVWIATADGGKIARSTDGGVSWGSLITNPFGTSLIRRIAYDGVGVWVAVGDDAKIARSTDDGVSWGSLITNPFSGTANIFGIDYGNSVWVAVGGTPSDGQIARSTDGGVSWGSLLTEPFGTTAVRRVVYGDGIWFASGFAGKLARSTNGGVFWGPSVYGDSEISQPYGANGNIIGLSYSTAAKRFILSGYDASTNDGLIATSDWLEAGSGIVEQGSNSNGHYVRFSSGVQVCWNEYVGANTDTGTSVAGTTSGTTYWRVQSITFPAAFASPPHHMDGSGQGSTGFLSLSASATSITTTGCTLSYGFRGVTGNYRSGPVFIGYWK